MNIKVPNIDYSEAIKSSGLFKKLGFVECDPFAHYKKDPNSCYMSLEI